VEYALCYIHNDVLVNKRCWIYNACCNNSIKMFVFQTKVQAINTRGGWKERGPHYENFMNEQDAQVQAIESRFIIDFLLFSFVVLSKYTNVSILKIFLMYFKTTI